MELAKRYNLESNEMFISCAQTYEQQLKIIKKLQDEVSGSELLCTKEYVKGRENLMANPLVKELPKHTDSANKTLALMLDILTKLGSQEKTPDSKLSKLMNE
jgi:hypothetical protein